MYYVSMYAFVFAPQVNETAAGRLFDEIADADDPTIATMEGE